MERAGASREQQGSYSIPVPQRALIALSGPAGSGKSTFAQQVLKRHRLPPTTVISSDFCRALICDDEASQQINRDTFDLFHYIIHKRMFQNRFTIADSTALYADARRKMLDLARRHNYHTCLLIFNITPQTCIERDRNRKRMVGEKVITYHMNLLQQALQETPAEGWNQIYILGEQDLDVTIEII
jgi:predicted kinase